MKNKLLAIFISLAALSGSALADLVIFDYSDAPKTVSVAPQEDAGSVADTLYFSTGGVVVSGGELRINVSGEIVTDKNNKSYSAVVELGSLVMQAASNDVLSVSTSFNTTPQPLVSVAAKNDDSTYEGFIALKFSAPDSKSYFGWAEVTAEASVASNGKTGLASISVLRMAINDTPDANIVVGAIPEPAVASLIILFGTGILFSRRIFTK